MHYLVILKGPPRPTGDMAEESVSVTLLVPSGAEVKVISPELLTVRGC